MSGPSTSAPTRIHPDAQEHGPEEETVRRELDLREEVLLSIGSAHLSAAARELLGAIKEATTPADRESTIGEAESRVEEELRGLEEELRSIPPGERYLTEATRALLCGEKRSPTLAERVSMVTTAERRLEKELEDREDRFVERGGSSERLAEAFVELCDDLTFGDGSSLPERWQIITLAEERYEEDRAADAEWSAILDTHEEMLRAMSTGGQHLVAAQRELAGQGQEASALEARAEVVRTARRRVEDELDERAAEVRHTAHGPAWLIEAQRQVVSEDGREPTLAEREHIIGRAWRRVEDELDDREAELRDTKQGPARLSEVQRQVVSEDGREPTLAERERTLEKVNKQVRADLDRRKDSLGETDEGFWLLSKAQQRRDDNATTPTLAEEERELDQVVDELREHRAAERRAARLQEEEEKERERRKKLARRVGAVRATPGGSQLLDAERRARFGTTTRALRVDEEMSIVDAVDMQILDRQEAEIAAHVGGEALLRTVKERRNQAVPFVSLAERKQTVVAVKQILRVADAVEALPTPPSDPEGRSGYFVPADAALAEAVTDDDPLFVQDVVFVLRARERGAKGGCDTPAHEESERRHLDGKLASAWQWWVLKIRELILKTCAGILGSHGDLGERVQELWHETVEKLAGGGPGGGSPGDGRAATRQAMLDHDGVMTSDSGKGMGAERRAPPQKRQPTPDRSRDHGRQGP